MYKFALISVAGLAAVATAEPVLSGAPQGAPTQILNGSDYFDISVRNSREGGTLIDLTAVGDVGYSFGFPAATSFLFDIGAAMGNSDNDPIRFFGVGWETTHTTNGASWLSEFHSTFTDSAGINGVDITVSATTAAGTEANSSNGIIKLDGLDPRLDFLLPDKWLLLSLWDDFEDFPGGGEEGFLHDGSVYTIQVEKIPAPGALAMLGLGGLVATRRRR